MLSCCELEVHPWQRYEAEGRWFPPHLRCLIVGENPGDLHSQYFYDPPESYTDDPVVVRRSLLRGLRGEALVHEATLEGFRDAGFLFDHAIRCPLPSEIVARERQRAMRYTSSRAEGSEHLKLPLAQATVVWVMGHLASNAVANATTEFPRKRRRISKPPYPAELGPRSRFFISEYFTWRNEKDTPSICRAFRAFAQARRVFTDEAV